MATSTSAADIVQQAAAGFEGEISLAAADLKTGAVLLHHPDRRCSTASVIKLPVLVHVALAVHEGSLSWCEPLTLKETDKVPGSGILTQLTAGLTLSLRDACMLMIALSDNTATNLVIDGVGVDAVTARMQSLGLPKTRLFRKVFSNGPPVSEENRRYGLGVTTPREMVRLLTMIQRGQLGGESTCSLIRGFLAAQHYLDGIPRLLPETCKFAGKSGAVDAVRNDVGLVTVESGHDIAMAIFCQKMPRPLWTADNPGLFAIARIARGIVQEFVRLADGAH